jgi:hypothetical protein
LKAATTQATQRYTVGGRKKEFGLRPITLAKGGQDAGTNKTDEPDRNSAHVHRVDSRGKVED